MIDLHLHSNCSDGALSPEQLVELAAERSISTLALSDHDTVSGVSRAIGAAEKTGICVIPGVELSVCYKNYTDIHLLGYFIDIEAPELTSKLQEFAERRANRNREIVGAVNQKLATEERIPLELGEVEKFAEGVLGRPHIARALIARGYVQNMEEAFKAYLVPCDIPKSYWPMEDALQTIKRIGGVAVLAHPTTITDDHTILAGLIGSLQQIGLDGIEVFNALASEYDQLVLQKLAQAQGLLITAGSDFHGISERDCIGKGRGGITFSDALLPPLYQRAERRQTECLSTSP